MRKPFDALLECSRVELVFGIMIACLLFAQVTDESLNLQIAVCSVACI
jgi:hypothetical protein